MSLTMTIDFAAEVGRLVENTKKSANAVSDMAGQIDGAISFAKNAFAALGVAAAAHHFIDLVRQQSEVIDQTAKMADRFGITTEAATGMNLAIKLAGGTHEGLVTALKGTTKTVAEAAQGAGEARDAYNRLGLSAKELSAMPVDQQFEKIVDALSHVTNATERNALGLKVMGKQYGEVAGLVAEGGEALRKAKQDAIDWGVAIDRVDSAKVEMANDAITRMQTASKGLYTTISVALAPAIKMVADYFSDAAKQSKGYKEEVKTGSEVVAQALAFTGDIIYAVQVAWSGMKLVVGTVIDFIIQTIKTADFAITELYNALVDNPVGRKLGLQKMEYSAFLQEMGDISHNRLEELMAETTALVEQGFPHDKIMKKYREVQAEMQKEAEETAKKRKQAPGEEIQEKADPYLQNVAQRLAKIQEADLSEVELEKQKHIEIDNTLQIALQKRLVTEDEYYRLSEQEAIRHQAAMGNAEAQGLQARARFDQMTRQQQASSVAQEMMQVTSGVTKQSRAMFEINKVAGIANAVINTYTGVSRTLSAYPYPWNLPMAALHLVAGIAQVQAISSAQFDSSSSPPSIGGGGATPTFDVGGSSGNSTSVDVGRAIPAAAPKTQINITLQGIQFSYDQVVNEIIPLINQAGDNGADIHVATA